MFTGIIQNVGTVTAVEKAGDSSRIRLATGFADLSLGESVAVNGVCLTVTEFTAQGEADFFVSPETLARTNLGRLAPRARVNLERAVSLSTRLSGHLVQGHVDGQGRFDSVTLHAESYEVRIGIPGELARYCVEKGSIALNGVSLTINSLAREADGSASVGITLIPHTWNHTQFHAMNPGEPVNVEVDILAKYVEKLCLPYLKR